MTYDNYDWITRHLAVGGLVDTSEVPFFDAILSLETYSPLLVRGLAQSPDVEYRWYSIMDGVSAEPHEAIVQRFNAAVDQVADWIRAGRRVLVHCYLGSSRAGTTATWYLVRHHALSWEESVTWVRERRRVTDPNIRFEIPLRLAAGEVLDESWLQQRLTEYCLARHDRSELAQKMREILADLERQGTLARVSAA